jgi:hypothetical protein
MSTALCGFIATDMTRIVNKAKKVTALKANATVSVIWLKLHVMKTCTGVGTAPHITHSTDSFMTTQASEHSSDPDVPGRC